VHLKNYSISNNLEKEKEEIKEEPVIEYIKPKRKFVLLDSLPTNKNQGIITSFNTPQLTEIYKISEPNNDNSFEKFEETLPKIENKRMITIKTTREKSKYSGGNSPKNSKPNRSLKASSSMNHTTFQNSPNMHNSLNKSKKSTYSYGPFLNTDYEKINKKVEIKNPAIKKLLTEIDYCGPYFSHCPSCSTKNMEYFKNINTDQGIKIF